MNVIDTLVLILKGINFYAIMTLPILVTCNVFIIFAYVKIKNKILKEIIYFIIFILSLSTFFYFLSLCAAVMAGFRTLKF